MSPERWKQVEEIFQSALDLPEAERTEYISTACAGDEELCRQVDRRLKQLLNLPPALGGHLDW